MNPNIQFNNGIYFGTAGGTITAFFNLIWQNDIVHTTLLSAMGAAVSFTVSMFLQSWFKKRKR